jgi:O-acetyl-ADP-ribose deacetylase
VDIRLIKSDITTIEADAIVNAANSSLLGGGGVDGAIHRKGGPKILEACQEIRNRQGGCPTGEAVITTAGVLPSKYVIHTVGPVWQGGSSNEHQLLRRCYVSCLELAVSHQVRSIAFPNISTGIYQFPKQDAAEVAIDEINKFEDRNEIEQVSIVCFDQDNYQIYRDLMGG